MDPIGQFKENQKAAWSTFMALENLTGTAAPKLLRFAQIAPGARLLDVGCGTGVVALTAARAGAKVSGVDLTPALIEHAQGNAAMMGLDVEFRTADAEELPFENGTFDAVVSQFGHMFAPRPEIAIGEMLRVLRPGGTLAFSTWPPELFTGRWFRLFASYAPPPPAGVSPPASWGDPNIVRERLGKAVKSIAFGSGTLLFQALSPQHYRVFMERSFGPLNKILTALDANEPARAAQLRKEIEALASEYFEENTVRQDYLITRAIKA